MTPGWKVHTPSLLAEVLKNPGAATLSQPINIFGRLLAKVAERASEIDDPALNILMLRLTLYDQADPEKFDFKEITAAFAEQEARLHQSPRGQTAEKMMAYPDPTPETLNDPLFLAIWKAIKGWDISRHNNGMYSGPTGNDARHIYDAIRSSAVGAGARLLTDDQQAVLERMAGHDPSVPGLTWPDDNLLIESAAQAAKDVLASLRGAALDRDKLWHIIAREIACEKDCQKGPNGCGCAQNVADAVVASLQSEPVAASSKKLSRTDREGGFNAARMYAPEDFHDQSEPVQTAGKGEQEARSALLVIKGLIEGDWGMEQIREVVETTLALPVRPEAPAGVREKVAAWFNKLPCDDIGKTHFDELMQIVRTLPSDPVRRTTQPIQRDSTVRLDSGEVRQQGSET